MSRRTYDSDSAISGALYSLATHHPSVLAAMRAAGHPELTADGPGWGMPLPGGHISPAVRRLAALHRYAIHLLVIGLITLL